MSTSNSLLSSSLSSGLMENKLLQSSKIVSFKRAISENQDEPCKRQGGGPGPSSSFQTGRNEFSSNKLLQHSGGLTVNKCLSSSILKTSTLSSSKGLTSSSALLSTKSTTMEAKARSKSSGTAFSLPGLLQKEEPRNEENLSVPSFPAYPDLPVEEESLKSKAKRFRSDLEQKNCLLPLEAKKVSQKFCFNKFKYFQNIFSRRNSCSLSAWLREDSWPS